MAQVVDLMSEYLGAAREREDESAGKVVLTLFAHPPAQGD